MEENKEFKPYIPADRETSEITSASLSVGIALAVLFGAANAYLGLRVGMTVSASIPAAVIAMGVIRVIMKKNSILESNIVQTVGSAGESVAAGSIFTLPALFLWAKEGLMDKPHMLEIALIALIGGVLGVFFMIPLRKALIVKEHNVLPYPEGSACAQVLLAGEDQGAGSATVFAGMGFAALFKFIIDGIKLVPGEITIRFKGYAGEIGTQIYPAVLSVGYICGPKIASYMFAGGLLSWMVIIPIFVMLGGDAIIYPGVQEVSALYEVGGATAIWKTYIRYIGAGALAAGGILSLIKSLPLIIATIRDTVKGMFVQVKEADGRTSREISMRWVITVILGVVLVIWLVPAIPVGFLGAVMVVVFGFLFATVSSRMVGIVGSSNNPVSGMAIATLLFSTFTLKLTGDIGISGMRGAIAIGSIICIIAAVSGDTSQDLKTGYLLGATPKKQQIGELFGVVASAVAIGGTLYLLDRAWGFGSDELAAPQATLMKLVVEGVMNGELPWFLVIVGALIAVVVEILGIPVLPFAIGVYLPIHLNACIMIGGLVRLGLEKLKKAPEEKRKIINDGMLFCSGMIAGEGLIGILLAILAIFGLEDAIDISGRLGVGDEISGALGICTLGLIIITILWFCMWKKEKK